MAFGTEEQKQRFLPPILKAEEFWCQGFSEPDAGSDLANVKTTAVLDGDEWVINGQKVWTSLGHLADWIFVVVPHRPDGPAKHQGISFLLCPIDQPGVDMRPIRQITGDGRVQRGLLRRRPHVRRPGRRRGRRRLEGRDGHPRLRAGHGVPRPAAALRRRVPTRSSTCARERGPTARPAIRHGSPTPTSASSSCASPGCARSRQLLNGGSLGPEASIGKLHWSRLAPAARRAGDGRARRRRADRTRRRRRLGDLQHTFLFSRAETIYAGSSRSSATSSASASSACPRPRVTAISRRRTGDLTRPTESDSGCLRSRSAATAVEVVEQLEEHLRLHAPEVLALADG